MARGHVERDIHNRAALGNGLPQNRSGLFIGIELRTPPPFVRDAREDASPPLEQCADRAMDEGHRFQRRSQIRITARNDEKILEFDVPSRVQTAGNDVDHRNRHDRLAITRQISPKR
jgi:hypothetical protein